MWNTSTGGTVELQPWCLRNQMSKRAGRKVQCFRMSEIRVETSSLCISGSTVDNYVEQLQMIPVLRVHQIELTKLMVTMCSPKDTEVPS